MPGHRQGVVWIHLAKRESGFAVKADGFGDERDRERDCGCLWGLGLSNLEEVAQC